MLQISLLERPAIDEAIVARGTLHIDALHIDAEKSLGDILSELDFPHLAGTDIASPTNSADEPHGFRFWNDQFLRELIVRLVEQECIVQPASDLLASAGDETGAGVVGFAASRSRTSASARRS